MYHPSRGGVRGGSDQFSWDSVKTDKYRENYLGHSLKAPVGRWQEGKDLSWYAKERNTDASKLKFDEKAAIKKAEEEAMLVALGFKQPKKEGNSLVQKQDLAEVLKRNQGEHSSLDVDRVSGLGVESGRAAMIVNSGSSKGGDGVMFETVRRTGKESSSEYVEKSKSGKSSSFERRSKKRKKEKKRKSKNKKKRHKKNASSSLSSEEEENESWGRKQKKKKKKHVSKAKHKKNAKQSETDDDDDESSTSSESSSGNSSEADVSRYDRVNRPDSKAYSSKLKSSSHDSSRGRAVPRCKDDEVGRNVDHRISKSRVRSSDSESSPERSRKQIGSDRNLKLKSSSHNSSRGREVPRYKDDEVGRNVDHRISKSRVHSSDSEISPERSRKQIGSHRHKTDSGQNKKLKRRSPSLEVKPSHSSKSHQKSNKYCSGSDSGDGYSDYRKKKPVKRPHAENDSEESVRKTRKTSKNADTSRKRHDSSETD